MRGRVLAIAIAVVVWAGVAGATDVVGNIITDTVWTVAGSPYIVKQNVNVRLGHTLTIQPGVTVAFDGNYFLATESGCSIVAQGSVGDSIRFTSNLPSPGAGSWNYVHAFSSPGSSFRYCTFEYAARGLYLSASNSPVEHCTFRVCAQGIYCTRTTSLISSCAVLNCTTAGITCNGRDAIPVIDNCDISNPGVGVFNMYLDNYAMGTTVSVDATHNWWGTAVETEIQDKIWDINDSASIFGVVVYNPFYTTPGVEPQTWGAIKALFRD